MIGFRNRRKHFFIQKPLQLRYVLYVVATLTIVSTCAIIGTYFGVWGSVIKAFSEEEIRETIITASRIYEYEEARRPKSIMDKFTFPSIRFFKETELLSERQKEILKQILDETHIRLAWLSLLLFIFIGWGSIYLTHKIAGPLYRFSKSFEALVNRDLTLRIRLRKYDEAQQVAQRFNEMMAYLDVSVQKMKRIADEYPKDLAIEELKKELAKFKTSS
ncbi:MAG: hypothetical protein A3G33_05585 [Omnitrophica bacterium RIFCSPLOWO2_12_FULL_44_17]|uniref:HAMP domain-containing protein n=1 Tax=Candidatus Danuiimicrobium aquiferis TaxID=1801832 RepID=A0A1G1L1S2_9BACT|nr:MAG: hypothetical protein A3B72_05505 [Omnitrophica bacterium RIFCSPHIGHO2_02_FULL_45_28]OGW91804.1 MAG: hypothetical protein A3E74_09850 [Omnitrophica bacterium RIFCSPHIGHO2_12_FULL_44_12]OGW99097.1 MAG: hypothetical protein A3G33_05585 [Omnitrophica bacterium RIFCSPLOWO2_12_FULL_44_17]OGX04359.1 MAG: hypothetical protein A3J12_09065 [Omnitrophica bacterium RIFCSPLOWO2_02_FULL_44_11]